MSGTTETSANSILEFLASGRRDLAVQEYTAAVENLEKACALLAKEHGETADECAEAYLCYGKALLGLSRQESGVFGDGIPGAKEGLEEEDNEEEENGDDALQNNDEAEAPEAMESDTPDTKEKEETTNDLEEPGSSNDDAQDEIMANLDNDDVDNLQLAWEILDLARSILERRIKTKPAARALLADVHLTLGEVALESETYDKALFDMMRCLEIQKELYSSDDRRIAETHYQIGLANSLSSNFEEAILHFKNAANILETCIKTLESGEGDSKAAEIKELKELLPEIEEKIQDMMDFKAETVKRVKALVSANVALENNGTSSSSEKSKPASNISHLIKRKRKSSESEEPTSKKVNT